jgi:hypothetical protein
MRKARARTAVLYIAGLLAQAGVSVGTPAAAGGDARNEDEDERAGHGRGSVSTG